MDDTLFMDDTPFLEQLARINQATGVKTQSQLADILGIKQSSVAVAKKRGNVPADWLLTLLLDFGINPVWVLAGEGPKTVSVREGAGADEATKEVYDLLQKMPSLALIGEIQRRLAALEGGEKKRRKK